MGAALLVGVAVRAQTQESHQYRYLMGTSIEVQAFGGDEATRRSGIDEAFAAFAEVDRLMSDYRDDSELALINRDASRGPVVGQRSDVRRAPRRGRRQRRVEWRVRRDHRTAGATVGLSRPRRRMCRRPPNSPAVRPLVDFRHVQLDADRRTVRLTHPGVALDLGGIAKGFAVDVAAGVLRRRGLSGFIDAGGNQYLLGAPPGKARWTVGIRDPEARGHVIAVVETGETSVSTSADSYNVLEARGRSYGHILDPQTLQPAMRSLSVTILSRDGTLADAMSKAAFVLGPKAGLALVDSFPGMSAVIVYRAPDGSIAVARSDSLASAYHTARP